MSAADLDLILVGGGLASSLIAWRLAIDRPELRVAVVEREGRLGVSTPGHSFDGDISTEDRLWLEPATPHRWIGGYEIYFPGLSPGIGGGSCAASTACQNLWCGASTQDGVRRWTRRVS